MESNRYRMYRLGLYGCVLATAALLGWSAPACAAPADDQYAEAAGFYAAGKWPEAAEGFGRFLDLHSDHERAATARFYRGESLVQAGKYEEAARQHDEFLNSAPEHSLARIARFRAGECLLLAGKHEEAAKRLAEFRAQHAADELNAFALSYLGEIALAAGQTAEAEGYYEQSLRDYPTGSLATESRFGLARCSQLSGKLPEAIALYESLASSPGEPLADDARLQIGVINYQLKQYAAAEESLSAFRTTFGGSDFAPQAMYWLGLSQTAAGRPAEAAATLAAAAGKFDETSQAPAFHAAAGDAFRRAGEPVQAQRHYEQLTLQWPESEWADDAMLARAEMALDAGDVERAAAIAGELARRFPASPHLLLAQMIRGRSLLAEQKFAEAEEALQQAPSVQPILQPAEAPSQSESVTDEQCRYFLALARLGQKKYEEALGTIEQLGALPGQHTLARSINEVRCSALLGLERYDEAIALLRSQLADEAQRSQPATTPIRVQLVVALARSGKLADATAEINLLTPAAMNDADAAAAVLLAAEGAYAANDLATAERLFSLAVSEGVSADQRSQALSGLAWTQFRRAGKQASAETFERLLREYPTSPLAAEAALVRARSLEDSEQVDAALATYRLVIDDYADSAQLPQALFGAARLHDRLDQDREAADLLTRLIDDHPQFAERDAAIYELSWVLTDLKDLPAAEAALARLAKDYPNSAYWADATCRLAEHAARRKETARAIELADQVLAAKTTSEVRDTALYLRGQLAAAESQWEEVARLMQEHVQQFPASALNLSAHYWRAEATFRQGDYLSAEKRLADLESAAKHRSEAWLGIVPLRRAQCLAQQKRWADALKIAQTIAARYPQFKQQPDADYLIGRCLGSQGKFDDARAAFERVLNSPAAGGTETTAMAQWMIGEGLFHQKRYGDAIAAYDHCARDSSFPRWQAAAVLQAGKCRLLLGETELARRDLERVVTEYTDQPLAEEAKARLASLPLAGRAVAPVKQAAPTVNPR